MKRLCNSCWILMAVAGILAAADAPYVGQWKLNLAKSKLTGETATIEQTSSGGMRYVNAQMSYEFKPDGKEYPTPGGGTASWKQESPNVWDVTIRTNGKVIASAHLVVNGDTLAQTVRRTKPDGGTVEDSLTAKRVSGGPGIIGKWKSTEVKATASGMEVASHGANGLSLKYPETGDICSAKFDGKDYPFTGPQALSKTTLSFKKTSPSSFETTEKIEGKAVYVDVYTVSPDGKTLTDDGTPISTKEPTKAVYDRQ